MTPEQASFVAMASPELGLPYSLAANEAAQVALFGNTPGGPSRFALIPTPLPVSFRGLAGEAGNYRTTEETYFFSSRFDHQISTNHRAFLRISASPSDQTGIPSNGQNQLTAFNAFSRTTNSSTRDFVVASELSSNLNPTWLSELRFQYARRGVGLTPNGTQVAAEILGTASIGQEPFAPLYRTEQRWQFAENLSHIRGSHTYKMGVDFNHLPIRATFPINQGGIYYFPSALGVDDPIIASAVGLSLAVQWKLAGAPPFSSAQAYGMGLPESFVQQFGGTSGTSMKTRNTTLGWFVQDSWRLRPNFTLNYGLRYDVEFTPKIAANSPLSESSQRLLGVMQGIPRDTNNWAPRAGFAWDPFKDGKTAVRGSYGLFYGHPLLAIMLLSDVVDGAKSPYLVVPHTVGADDLFHGEAFTPLGGAVANPFLGYLGSEQRFNPSSPAFTTQASALGLSPILSTVLPVAGNFQYDSAMQGTFGVERQINSSTVIALDYTYTHGTHLLRPRNINQGNFNLIAAYDRAAAVCPSLPGVEAAGCANPFYRGVGGSLAGLWDALGGNLPTSLAPLGQLFFNQFRATGPNYAWANTVSGGALSKPVMDSLVGAFNLPHAPGNAFVPYFNVKEFESSGSSIYHGLTATLRKRYSRHFQLLGSYTWSHAIDDSTDLQTVQEPQDNTNTRLDRGNSNFDQRHRFVVSGVFDTSRTADATSFFQGLVGNWTLAPIIELSSGRPYSLLTYKDSSIINSPDTARPNVVAIGTLGSYASPDGKVGLIQPPLGSVGNLGRKLTLLAVMPPSISVSPAASTLETASARISVPTFSTSSTGSTFGKLTNPSPRGAAQSPPLIQDRSSLGSKSSFDD